MFDFFISCLNGNIKYNIMSNIMSGLVYVFLLESNFWPRTFWVFRLLVGQCVFSSLGLMSKQKGQKQSLARRFIHAESPISFLNELLTAGHPLD